MTPTCYILHFDRPFHHARHYVGCSRNLEARLELHHKGQSQANLTRVIHDAGIGFVLARTWVTEKAFELESHIKKHYKATVKLCPICNPANHHGEFKEYMT